MISVLFHVSCYYLYTIFSEHTCIMRLTSFLLLFSGARDVHAWKNVCVLARVFCVYVCVCSDVLCMQPFLKRIYMCTPVSCVIFFFRSHVRVVVRLCLALSLVKRFVTLPHFPFWISCFLFLIFRISWISCYEFCILVFCILYFVGV